MAGAVSGMVGSGMSKVLTSKVKMLTPMAVNGLSGMVETVAENTVLGVRITLSDLGLAFVASTVLPVVGDNLARGFKRLAGQGDSLIRSIRGLDGQLDNTLEATAQQTYVVLRQVDEVLENVAQQADSMANAGGKPEGDMPPETLVEGFSSGQSEDSSPSNQTLLSGNEWYRYFQDIYGVDNVNWNVSSFDDILNHPTSLRGYSADEIGQILGDGWVRDTYGSNASGWKFIEKAHPDHMVFYHGGGGKGHGGAYYGISTGGKNGGRVKVVDVNTYHPTADDDAIIIYNEDW